MDEKDEGIVDKIISQIAEKYPLQEERLDGLIVASFSAGRYLTMGEFANILGVYDADEKYLYNRQEQKILMSWQDLSRVRQIMTKYGGTINVDWKKGTIWY